MSNSNTLLESLENLPPDELGHVIGRALSVRDRKLEIEPPPDPAGIQVVSGARLNAIAAPIPWIWQGWLPQGALTLLAGQKGMGKSTLALHVAAKVTRGECPGQNGKPGRVLLWSGEDDYRIIAAKGIAAGWNADNIELLVANGDRPFDPARDGTDLLLHLEKDPPALLIIDPIIRLLRGANNAAEDVRQSLDDFAARVERLGVTLLGVGHFTKGSGDRPIVDRYMGSGAWTHRARMVWGVIDVGEDRLFGKAATNLADSRGVYPYEIEETTVKTPEHGNVLTTRVVLEDPITDETLDEAERRMKAENALKAVDEKYAEDVSSARVWLRERGGWCTGADWEGHCESNRWGTQNSRACRAVVKALQLRTTYRGRPPERETYRHLPEVTPPQ